MGRNKKRRVEGNDKEMGRMGKGVWDGGRVMGKRGGGEGRKSKRKGDILRPLWKKRKRKERGYDVNKKR